jgi:hypothetical protein
MLYKKIFGYSPSLKNQGKGLTIFYYSSDLAQNFLAMLH